MKKQKPDDKIVKDLLKMRAYWARWKVDFVAQTFVQMIDECLYKDTDQTEEKNDG